MPLDFASFCKASRTAVPEVLGALTTMFMFCGLAGAIVIGVLGALGGMSTLNFPVP
jgi:hypothetical protein